MEMWDFAVGDKVEHPKFGKGQVTAVIGEGANAKIRVNFGKEFGEKKLVLQFAKLKKVIERAKLAGGDESESSERGDSA